MDNLKHTKSGDGRITKPAPHPRGSEINPKEYYMSDNPRDGIGFMATSGQTHSVWFSLDHSATRIITHPCETWQQAQQCIEDRDHVFLSKSPAGIIQSLRDLADKLEKQEKEQPSLPGESYQGMPYAGMKVWVIAPDGSPAEVQVSEVGEMSGKMSVIFGFHYKQNGEWFWSKEEAEEYLSNPKATSEAKNVFL